MNFIRNMFRGRARGRTISILLVIILYAVVMVMKSTGNMTRLLTSLLVPVCCYQVAAIGLNMNVGFSGELNLGQAGFMSIGGFTAAVATAVLSNIITNDILLLAVVIVIGAASAGFCGWVISIPVLKLQGDYLAIVTLAFGQIIMSILNNLYVGVDSAGIHMSFATNSVSLADGGKMIISGPMGVTGNPTVSTFTAGTILVIISLIIVYNLILSKNGRAIEACRDNRIAAETVGITVSKAKTLAFIVSSALGGAAGALYMMNYSSVAATKFNFNTSILILVYVVLGGLGNMTGTLIATTILVMLPEMLRFLSGYRMLIYAVILILIMIITNNEKLKTVFAKLKRNAGKKEAGNNV